MTLSSDRPRLLLVDDDNGLRSTLACLLAHDFQVTQEVDGKAGIARLASEAFDVVLTDLEMPYVSGDELVAWVAEHRPTLAGRVIILSGGAKDPSRARWLQAFDPRRVLYKPCCIEAVMTSIREALGGP